MENNRKVLVKIIAPEDNNPDSTLDLELNGSQAEISAGLETALKIDMRFFTHVSDALASLISPLDDASIDEFFDLMKSQIEVFRCIRKIILGEDNKKETTKPSDNGRETMYN